MSHHSAVLFCNNKTLILFSIFKTMLSKHVTFTSTLEIIFAYTVLCYVSDWFSFIPHTQHLHCVEELSFTMNFCFHAFQFRYQFDYKYYSNICNASLCKDCFGQMKLLLLLFFLLRRKFECLYWSRLFYRIIFTAENQIDASVHLKRKELNIEINLYHTTCNVWLIL